MKIKNCLALPLIFFFPAAAHSASTQKYTLTAGSSGQDIAKSLFGDEKYWPASSKDLPSIHLIEAGAILSYVPGTDTSLPSLSLTRAHSDTIAMRAGSAPSGKKPRSMEWKDLPIQSWERASLIIPKNIDALGFDQSASKIRFNHTKGFELHTLSTGERLEFLGQITGSRSPAEYVSIGDTVYIRADAEIQVGETYAITDEPLKLNPSKSSRTGLAYSILGKVKIIGVRDNLFVGMIVAGYGLIYRGTSIIASPATAKELEPIAGPSEIEGVISLDKTNTIHSSAQHKLVFIDKGTEDGVKPGMVFRVYEHIDPSTEREISASDFIIQADIQVVQTSATYSSGIVISSLSAISENSTATLLTDVSDLNIKRGIREKSVGDPTGDTELDDLDKLEGGGSLGKEEQKELEQLENWKGNPPKDETIPGEPPPPPPSEGSDMPPPPPIDDMTPPPPLESGTISDPPPPAPPVDDVPPPPPLEPVKEDTAPSKSSSPSDDSSATSDDSKALDQIIGQ